MAELQRLLDRLDEAFTSTREDEIANLIAVSFVENLPMNGEQGEDIKDLLGPGLRSELERIGW